METVRVAADGGDKSAAGESPQQIRAITVQLISLSSAALEAVDRTSRGRPAGTS